MSMIDQNPRAVPGDNVQTIDFAQEEMNRLERDYGYIKRSIEELLAESAPITVVDNPETKSKVMSLIKRQRDEAKRINGIHELEKMPHYRRGQAVDQFFFGAEDKLAKRDRRANDGESDRLNRILTDYDTRVLLEEQERRRREAAEAARKAEELRQAQAKAAREAEEKRLAAERARLPETRETKQGAAVVAEQAASAATVEAAIATDRAEEAYVETLARPADIMRTRGDDGTLGTMGNEKFAEITDKATLDLDKLRPYLNPADLEKALRRYADSVGYSADASVQITGARFGKRAKSVVR